jgi:peptide/nickel transport system permease protein
MSTGGASDMRARELAPPSALAPIDLEPGEARFGRGRTWLRFRRHRLALVGLIVLAIFVVLAVLAPIVTPYNPTRGDLRAGDAPPSWEHPLGTDGNGRDYLSRLIYGARISLSVGIVASSIAAAIGTVLGIMSGYYGGRLDMVVQRFTEIVMTFPGLLIVITLVAYVGPSIFNIMIVLGLLGWTGYCRIVRGQVLALRELAFVEAARSIGVTNGGIMARHILPNVVPYVVVGMTLHVGGVILTEAGLSFLGLGVRVPTPSWGNMLQAAQSLDVLVDKPWRWIAPGAAIAICVLAVNFVGDGLRDALDPRSRLG